MSKQFPVRKNNYVKDKKFLIYIILLSIISTILRSIYFEYFGKFMNDDGTYINLAENIWNYGIISVDGVTPHLNWPPGYPFILGFQKLFFKTYFDLMRFNYIYGLLCISLLGIYTGFLCGVKNKYILSTLLLTNPSFISICATLPISSEIIYTIIVNLGIIFTLRFYKKCKFIDLYCANILFSISYLMRPEGLIFFICPAITILLQFKSRYLKSPVTINSKYISKIFFSFTLPIILFIVPYLYFLYNNLGYFILSGKFNFNKEQINTTFSSLTDKYINNFVDLIDLVFFSPNFIFPFFTFGLIIVLALLLIKRIKFKYTELNIDNLLIISSPIPIMLFVLIYYMSLGRAIIVLLPIIFILISVSTDLIESNYLCRLKLNTNAFARISVLLILIVNIVLLQYPFSRSLISQSPVNYYRLIDKISNYIEEPAGKVYSRYQGIKYYKTLGIDRDVCSLKEECSEDTRFFLLSNSQHPHMQEEQVQTWEEKAIQSKLLFFEKKSCSFLFDIKRSNDISYAAFECK